MRLHVNAQSNIYSYTNSCRLGSLNSCDVIALALALVENLSIVPVNSSPEILSKLNDGIRNRSIASTNMNETSRCVVVSQQGPIDLCHQLLLEAYRVQQ